ncbi:hypothetical protein ACFLSA_06775 [Bacteroidota bacterium]
MKAKSIFLNIALILLVLVVNAQNELDVEPDSLETEKNELFAMLNSSTRMDNFELKLTEIMKVIENEIVEEEELVLESWMTAKGFNSKGIMKLISELEVEEEIEFEDWMSDFEFNEDEKVEEPVLEIEEWMSTEWTID